MIYIEMSEEIERRNLSSALDRLEDALADMRRVVNDQGRDPRSVSSSTIQAQAAEVARAIERLKIFVDLKGMT